MDARAQLLPSVVGQNTTSLEPGLQQFLFEAARVVGIYSSAPEKLPAGPWELWGAEVQGNLERTCGR